MKRTKFTERAWWYASGRLDGRPDTWERPEAAEDTFCEQYGELRRLYETEANHGCPSMRHAWRLFVDTGDAVAAWDRENTGLVS